ncbi:MAG: ectonucleotide pyrophosphatase/phosphodiesterase [Bacteroidota bacterium]
MNKINSILILFSLLLTQNITSQKNPYVILVSFDGFRWDYCNNTFTPTFDSIEAKGVKAKSLKPSFPTKTFPNHYTIATGLYPDNHGIVHNTFFVPEKKVVYKIADRTKVQDGYYYKGTPIWNLAETQGVKSASFFWVGSEAKIQNQQASYWKEYEHNFPFEQRVDTVIKWLKLPEKERPHLILLYFHEPDSHGHKYGPDSEEMKSKIQYLDSILGYLTQGLSKLEYTDQINLIITSDHGMGAVSKEKVVVLKDNLKEKWLTRILGANPNYNLSYNKEYKDSVINALKKIKHIQFWEREDIPKRLHYGKSNRIGDISIVADSSWSIVLNKHDKINYKGAHGYDNDNKDMHAIFYAVGPAFKDAYTAPELLNIDIYPLITHILGLKTNKIDGNFRRIKEVLLKK